MPQLPNAFAYPPRSHKIMILDQGNLATRIYPTTGCHVSDQSTTSTIGMMYMEYIVFWVTFDFWATSTGATGYFDHFTCINIMNFLLIQVRLQGYTLHTIHIQTCESNPRILTILYTSMIHIHIYVSRTYRNRTIADSGTLKSIRQIPAM